MASYQQPTSEMVVDVVAAESGREPLDMPPLYDAVDPDALDGAVGSLQSGSVSFQYAGYDVTVQSDGTVDVTATSSFATQGSGGLADD